MARVNEELHSFTCPYTLHWDALPLKIVPSSGGSGPHLIRGSLGPPATPVLDPNGGSIDSAVFCRAHSVPNRQTDRQTDHATWSVTTGRIYVRSTAMRPNNKTLPKSLTSSPFFGHNCKCYHQTASLLHCVEFSWRKTDQVIEVKSTCGHQYAENA